jgi:iron complex outermembrane receptor protein
LRAIRVPHAVAVMVSIAATLLASTGAWGLELRIVTPEGEPMAGARVKLVGGSGTLVADGDGRCAVTPDPEPPFVLFVARSDGVALKPVTVTSVPDAGPLEVVVEPSGETVTVVSGAVPDLEVPPAAAVTVLGGADLRQRNPTRLAESLENVPGASGSGVGHAMVPGLRGLPKHRTLIVLDDGRVSSERRAGPSATFLDPATVDEVEVIRGPGSVAYGSDAFGGVIRARSRISMPGDPLSVGYGVLLGSNADERAANAEVSKGLRGGGLLLGAHYRNFDDYRSPHGVVPVSGATGYGIRLALQQAVGEGMLRVGWRSDLERDVGKPTPDSDEVRRIYPEENSHRFNIGFERPGPGSWTRLEATLAWDDYGLVLDVDRLAAGDTARTLKRSDVTANDYELRFEAERPLGLTRLVLGTNVYGRYDLHSVNSTVDFGDDGDPTDTTTEVAIERARRDDLGIFAGLERDVGRWGLAAGLRFDSVMASNRGGYFGDVDSTNTGVSGFFSVSFRINDRLGLTGQAARGFRDALLSDRFYRGITGRGFITGNPDLRPETSAQYDVAVRYQAGRFNLAAYGYLYRIADLIERYSVDGDFYFRNRALAEIRGLEVEGELRWAHGLSLLGGAQYLRGEVRDDGTPTDDIPPPGIFVVLRGEPNHRWWWMVRAAAYARDDRPGPTEQEVPGYEVLDAGVTWTLSRAVQLQLLGRNLLDSAHLVSADEDAVLAPGRAIQLSLRGAF